MLEKHITNREFFRNPKKYKELLGLGKLHILFLPLDEERNLKITVEGKKKARTGKELAELFRRSGPLHIKRPEGLFDDLLDRAERRRHG